MPDSDATIMIPRPGGKRAPAAEPAQPAAPARRVREAAYEEPAVPAAAGGVNPLLAAANPVLTLIPQIRATLAHPDPKGLRDYLLHAISEFEQHARQAGVAPEKIVVARYAMCTVVDETVASTPWGGTSLWARESLLVTLHKETWGGEKFFQLLHKMLEDPQRNLDLIELMYACLALGFEGRFRVLDNGKAQLNELRNRVYQTIRQQRGEYERDLAAHWRGVARKPKALIRQIPPWVIFSAIAFVLFAVFLTLVILLNQSSDPVFSNLAGIKANTGNLQRAAAPIAKPRLRTQLSNEIAQGLLDVQEDAQMSRVIIHGDNLFEPGSADLNPALVPVIQRIAAALNEVPGAVVVTGHTDDVPIRSLRFPSNYHLSLERANSVLAMLAKTLRDPSRMRAEGMADAQPLAPNDSPANRARNRRVEILLRVAG
ncbi:DotU family type VI secretion system protein [Parasulfuritortus cantonensis]|uniref:DotU family type VI secretion system protein n=2 Tax=Parasulfuritortus cantonensis TaxID=2528202 RepID=A0A4V2NX98_9PROT|nr:DotU family type VI secretion system protein [Parasulfuritortus cantonensis]